jgi:hypothetical protein
MSGIQQMLTGGTYKPAGPTTIGQAYGGGYYAGQIAVGGGGVATHYLIVSPKASGEDRKPWGIYGVPTAQTSVIDGPTNSAVEAALGASYEAAVFAEGLTIGGYSDWYLPAKNELEVLYYFLKPTTDGNNTSYGSNANAVSPEPVSQNYTSASIPARTSAGIGFRLGETNAFVNDYYWSSSEVNSNAAFRQGFDIGNQISGNKFSYYYVRAVRRIPV